jgi:hypothetical protein
MQLDIFNQNKKIYGCKDSELRNEILDSKYSKEFSQLNESRVYLPTDLISSR